MTDAPIEAPVRRRAWLWPAMICAALAAHALFCVAVVMLAVRDPSFATEPDYYQKSLNWNEEASQLHANQSLGWSIEMDVAEPTDPTGRRPLSVVLRNRDGQTLGGAQIELIAFSHTRAADRTSVQFSEDQVGAYSATLQVQRKGIWEFRFTVDRGPDRFTQTIQRDLTPAAERQPWRP